MNTLDELTWASAEKTDLIRQINGFDQRIEQTRSNLTESQSYLDRYQGAQQFYTTQTETIDFNSIVDSHIKTAVEDYWARFMQIITSDIYLAADEVNRLNDSLGNNTQSLAHCKARLRQLEDQQDSIIIKRSDVVRDLSFINAISERSIVLSKDAREEPMVRWVYTGLRLTPLRNTYNTAVTSEFSDGIPSVPLLPVIAKFYPRTGSVKLSPRPSNRRLCPFIWGGKGRVHPHVLDGDNPCSGSYGGNISEALNSRDWGTLALIVQAMLQSADPDDSAGKHWVRFFIESLKKHTGSSIYYRDGLFTDTAGRQYKIHERNTLGSYFVETVGSTEDPVPLTTIY